MLWLEDCSGCGPCGFEEGSWYWHSDFETIKDFSKKIILLTGLVCMSDTQANVRDFKLSFAEIINKYGKKISISKKSLFLETINNIVDKNETSLVDLNISVYNLIKEFQKNDVEINAYLFDSPYSARALIESHNEEFISDFNEMFEDYFTDDEI